MKEELYSIKELIFFGFIFVGMGIVRFLAWIMPKTGIIVYEYFQKQLTSPLIKKIDKLINRIDAMSKELSSYKADKHRLKGENLSLKEVIMSDDEELLSDMRSHLKGKKNESEE